MPRRPKRPNKKRKFRLQVVLDGAVVPALDEIAAKLCKTYEHATSRSDVVRMALREFTSARSLP